ncbi:hypothetical protein ACIP3A_17925 [Streptomyces tricolor]|uniref:hypothetical protein n=1 Tax=Streptomyces TaxID=1883 RepID=UPI000B278ED6|nr:hypothetical protein [Streptomyces sp. PBH53]
MRWDDITLAILAAFGCVTLLLAQIDEVLGRLPRIIRAWRRVRRELDGGTAEPPDTPDGDRARLGEETDGTTP